MSDKCFENFIKNNFSSYPVLTNEEVIEYLEKYHAGDRSALDYVCFCNYRLVLDEAKKSENKGLDVEDMFQEGYRGLIRAAEKYDSTMGAKFSTYAVKWIYAAISRAIRKQTRAIAVPEEQIRKISRMKCFEDSYYEEQGRYPADTEIAAELKTTVDEVALLRETSDNCISLDYAASEDDDDNGSALYNTVAAGEAYDPVGLYEHRDLYATVNHALNMLSERERQIVIRRYGLFGRDAETLASIGADLGISREMVRAIEQKALKQLYMYREMSGLDAYNPAA